MPSEDAWQGYFRPAAVLAAVGLTSDACDVVDIGCGYGTFTLPAASIVRGTVYAFDIEPEMVLQVGTKASRAGLGNVRAVVRDVVAEGAGLSDGSVDYVMLFNLLHCEDPVGLLREAARVLKAGGLVGVIHWNYDATTPRGPSMSVRPRPEQCVQWGRLAGLTFVNQVDLPPYHYGLTLTKP